MFLQLTYKISNYWPEQNLLTM